MARHQNVLFILIDQLRADLLDGALSSSVELPNLRALMRDAVTFNRHYSVANPCGPSRTSILTGQYAMNHRSVRNGSPLRHDTPNLATEARKVGYQPLLFGYTDSTRDPRMHHPSDPAIHSYEQLIAGFDEVVEMRYEESYPWRAYLAQNGYDLPCYSRFYVPTSPNGNSRALNGPAFYRAEDSDTAFLTDCCLKQLTVRQEQSWFAHLTYIRPHQPLVAPAPYNDMYDPRLLPLPVHATDRPEHPFLQVAQQYKTPADYVDGFPDLDASEENIRMMRSVYLGLATEVDHHIGRLMDFLRKTGQYDDTLIVIGADHGEMLGDHGAWGKSNVYNAAYHVPLIIRDPHSNKTRGTIIDDHTETVDIMPTILDWLSAPVPASVNGRSLMPYLTDGRADNRRNASYSELAFGDPVNPTCWQTALGLSEAEATLSILRTDNFTLGHFGGDLPPILFDHRNEGEMVNVANEPDYAKHLLEMTQALLSHRMKYPDTTLSKIMITNQGPITGT